MIILSTSAFIILFLCLIFLARISKYLFMVNDRLDAILRILDPDVVDD